MRVTASDLVAFTRCPVGTFRSDPFMDSILTTSKSLLRLASETKLTELKDARDVFSKSWAADKTVEFKRSDVYLRGHSQIPGIALRVVQLIRDYQILIPPMRVDLILDRGTIEVDYAVAKPWREDKPILCLSLNKSRPAHFWRYPSAVGLSRWLDLQQRQSHKDIQLLNVPLCNGKPWITKGYSVALVRRQLNSILDAKQATGPYARPGAHCESCSKPQCLEMA